MILQKLESGIGKINGKVGDFIFLDILNENCSLDVEIQTEEEREKVEKYLLKRPY